MVLPTSPFGIIKTELIKIRTKLQKISRDSNVQANQPIAYRIQSANQSITEIINYIENHQKRARNY